MDDGLSIVEISVSLRPRANNLAENSASAWAAMREMDMQVNRRNLYKNFYFKFNELKILEGFALFKEHYKFKCF